MIERKRRMKVITDAIIGEINRMCKTDDIAELDTMAFHAKMNIKGLQALRYAELQQKGVEADNDFQPKA